MQNLARLRLGNFSGAVKTNRASKVAHCDTRLDLFRSGQTNPAVAPEPFATQWLATICQLFAAG
jgi:hypothetical protein